MQNEIVKKTNFHIAIIIERGYHFTLSNPMELSDLDLYHTEHCALVQNKQLGTLKGMVHITYLWVSCWRYFFFYIGNSFICKTSPTSNDSDLIQQPQWESCLVNDDLPETYLFKAVWIHLMWLMISFTISLLSLACVQYKNVILQSLYISERYIKHLQIWWKSFHLLTFVIL